ncbi:hypothetical protein FSP39_010741 [Pinctada imbricata]|uniref:Transposase domain-containing protein n=1 Tax=Pinctada imbricata TaxID=66713 RepID=A0AA89C3A8_PINIB|nr:hypothetical protein FSP39_010741 [Pinctada imbricata]
MRGPTRDTKLSKGQIDQISDNLLFLKNYIPSEFARKPRSLDEIDRWKATEFRQFVLYTGQFALKGILTDNVYDHFMCLCVAVNILVNGNLSVSHSGYAHSLLQYFVEKCSVIYGPEFLVYNVHILLHLKSDADKYGSLDNCAAWIFENDMQQLKRKVRSGNNPVAQIVKRVQETLEVKKIEKTSKHIRFKRPDNMFRTDSGKYCEVLKPTDNEEKSFLCRVYNTCGLSFSVPCNSDLIGQSQFQQFSYEMKTLSASALKTRCIQFPVHPNKVVFLPLQHEF